MYGGSNKNKSWWKVVKDRLKVQSQYKGGDFWFCTTLYYWRLQIKDRGVGQRYWYCDALSQRRICIIWSFHSTNRLRCPIDSRMQRIVTNLHCEGTSWIDASKEEAFCNCHNCECISISSCCRNRGLLLHEDICRFSCQRSEFWTKRSHRLSFLASRLCQYKHGEQ